MIAAQPSSPLKFFLLVFALSVPFWLIGAVTGLELLPGLPVSSLMACCPLLAALILVCRENSQAADTGLEVATRWGADIIVMGTAGRRGLERLFVGSVAGEMVWRSTVPVLTVRVPTG
jgi:Universal stress protein family